MQTKLANPCQPIIGPMWYLDLLRVLSLPAGFLMCAPRRLGVLFVCTVSRDLISGGYFAFVLS
jgi:hypothetical protein